MIVNIHIEIETDSNFLYITATPAGIVKDISGLLHLIAGSVTEDCLKCTSKKNVQTMPLSEGMFKLN